MNFLLPKELIYLHCSWCYACVAAVKRLIDRRISFYSKNTDMLPRKPKISYLYLKSGIEEFHRKYVFVPADKAANNIVVV